MLKRNKKQKENGVMLSIRLYDEKFSVIFGITKHDYKEGLKEFDKLLKLKFGSDINGILRSGKGTKTKRKPSNSTSRDS